MSISGLVPFFFVAHTSAECQSACMHACSTGKSFEVESMDYSSISEVDSVALIIAPRRVRAVVSLTCPTKSSIRVEFKKNAKKALGRNS